MKKPMERCSALRGISCRWMKERHCLWMGIRPRGEGEREKGRVQGEGVGEWAAAEEGERWVGELAEPLGTGGEDFDGLFNGAFEVSGLRPLGRRWRPGAAEAEADLGERERVRARLSASDSISSSWLSEMADGELARFAAERVIGAK